MDFGEMKDEVLTRLSESVSSPRRVSRDEIGAAINEGLQDMSLYCSFYETFRLLKLRFRNNYYNLQTALGSDVLYITRAQNLVSGYWMIATSQLAMDSRVYAEWEANLGDPKSVIPVGLRHLAIHPVPNDEATVLRVFCTALHPKLKSDRDVPDLHDDFHNALVEYGLGEVFLLNHELKLAIERFQKYYEAREDLATQVNMRFAHDRVGGLRG